MPHLSNAAIIFLIAVCAFFVIAKLFKVEKGAAVLAVGVIILWVVLHLTGYDKILYRIIFDAPPVQPPETLSKR
jgi:hypothetical protein